MFKSIFISLMLAFMFSACSIAPKVPLQVLTWEYIGGDCSKATDDINDLRTLKSWLDFKDISLTDAKGLVVARIINSDMLETRKMSLLAIVSSVEVNVDTFGQIDENAIYLTASEYIANVIEAYEMVC